MPKFKFNFKWWTPKTKPERRLQEIQDRIQDEEVNLLNARMNAGSAEGKLVALRDAELALLATMAQAGTVKGYSHG